MYFAIMHKPGTLCVSFFDKATHATYVCIPYTLQKCTDRLEHEFFKNMLTWYALVESIIVTAIGPASGHPCYANSDTAVRESHAGVGQFILRVLR